MEGNFLNINKYHFCETKIDLIRHKYKWSMLLKEKETVREVIKFQILKVYQYSTIGRLLDKENHSRSDSPFLIFF